MRAFLLDDLRDGVRETALDPCAVDCRCRELVRTRSQVFDHIARNTGVIHPDRISEGTAITAPQDAIGGEIRELGAVFVLCGWRPVQRNRSSRGTGSDHLDRECRQRHRIDTVGDRYFDAGINTFVASGGSTGETAGKDIETGPRRLPGDLESEYGTVRVTYARPESIALTHSNNPRRRAANAR